MDFRSCCNDSTSKITLKKHVSNIKTYMDIVKHLECGQAIGSLQADNLPKCVCRYFLYKLNLIIDEKNNTKFKHDT